MDLFGTTARDLAIDALHAATAIYTAEPVVEELLDNINWPQPNRRMVDTSCGDGMFLGRALSRLLIFHPSITDEDILDTLEGWEIHPGAAAQARARITAILANYGRSLTTASAVSRRLVRNADFLIAGPDSPRYHAVVGNPPYLRFVNVPPLLRDEYTACLPDHACSDLLHSFLDRCAKALYHDGEIALVTADRWLFGVGAAKLRSSLGNQLGIHQLRRLDAATAFYRPKQRRKSTPPRIHPVSIIMRPPSECNIMLSADPIYPNLVTPALPTAESTLDHVATVKLAPWLGAAGIFVVDEAVAATLPHEALVPVMDTDDVCDGVLQTPQRYAIRTCPDAEPSAAIMTHLTANMHRMARRGRRKQSWMPPESWHNLVLDRPCLFIPRIARSLRPVRVPAGVLPMNHNLIIKAADDVALAKIEHYLMTEDANEWMRAHAAPLENGFYALTAPLLRKLPVNLQHLELHQ